MSSRWTLWSAWTDVLPESVLGYAEGPVGIVLLVLAGAVAVYVLARLAVGLWHLLVSGRARPEDGAFKVRLAELPAPPDPPGPRRLTVEGIPVRVRLVVLAPVG